MGISERQGETVEVGLYGPRLRKVLLDAIASGAGSCFQQFHLSEGQTEAPHQVAKRKPAQKVCGRIGISETFSPVV